jgi:hypothetical protein
MIDNGEAVVYTDGGLAGLMVFEGCCSTVVRYTTAYTLMSTPDPLWPSLSPARRATATTRGLAF